MAPRVSVVVATFNRPELLVRLLGDLAKQTVDPDDFEVIVVDDGSRLDPAPAARALKVPFPLTIHRQINQGAAVARHKGVELAKAPIVLFIDDDMHVPPQLVAEHLRVHEKDPRAAVLGRIREDESVRLALHERFHSRILDQFIEDVRSGKTKIRGTNVYTGNFSVRREAYLRVGGFDPTLRRSEDAELGVRLEKDGQHLVLADLAYTIHTSDHASVDEWLGTAHRYGKFDSVIGQKHADMPETSPWRYVRSLGLTGGPVMAFAIALPNAAHKTAQLAMHAMLMLDRFGLEDAALGGTKAVFAAEYARGMRDEAGGARRSLLEYFRWAEKSGAKGADKIGVAAMHLVDAVREDHATMRYYQTKYGRNGDIVTEPDLGKDAIQRIGFQIMVAYRMMRFLREAGIPFAPQVASRLIRHIYGSDIHWEAELAPGVMIVHGMGLCISRYASVGRGVILFQHVTLGDSTHPETRKTGGPTIEDDVHVGAGAVIVGPVRIGARSKIMPTAVVRTNVPADSLVSVPDPVITSRTGKRNGGTLHAIKKGS
jgi:serine acetyltransferase/GT2 family glycosyltransferase